MADISKINAVLLANIAEIDDVLAANIAKVNGLVFSTAPAFTGLLDTYTGAAAGYSTRRIASSATNLMRIREDSGDTETDIGYDSNGDLDTAAIATHCGTANGYVVTWYDQSGNANNATQSTSGSQPQIYNGTAVITENGKPSMDFDGSNDHFDISASLGITGSQARSTFFVLRPEATSSPTSYQTYFGIGDNTTLSNGQIWDLWPEWSVRIFGGFEKYNTATINAQYLSTNILSGTDVTDNAFFLDGAEQTATSSTAKTVNTDNTVQRIGRTGSSVATGPYFTGQMQEVVIWASAQTTNRSGIEGNVNAHFQIGNFGTPTSGLLATYTGAAAAYSVRQLANTAALAMRIREDGTDTETDIGFDSNGDLATADIAAFCGSNNGYVVTWYDQAGSQVDATQSTGSDQPQIYNGTAVITENGKPALDFDGSSDKLLNASLTANSRQDVFYVRKGVNDGNSHSVLGFPTTTANTQIGIYYLNAFTAYGFNTWNGDLYGISSATSVLTAQNLEYAVFKNGDPNTSGVELYINGTSQSLSQVYRTSLSRTMADGFRIATGGDSNVSQDFHGTIQEIVIYSSDQSSNRTGIESDINGYFSIYT